MSRETLPARIADFFERTKGQNSLHSEQKDECVAMWAELMHQKYYCGVCSSVVTRAWEELRAWHEQHK
jgi:hypothetical protein